MKNISALRVEYRSQLLDEKRMSDIPIEEFNRWFSVAKHSGIVEPNAMTLATATLAGKPSARVVLLKDVTSDGFVFFTNYESRKGKELFENPLASVVFDWHEIARQVRVEGTVEKIPTKESEAYFVSRPRASQLGAWVSAQSSVIENRQRLDALKNVYEKQFKNRDITRPEYWGGYLLRPSVIEFWQGNENRLHDRIIYIQTNNGWIKKRLAP